MSVAPHLNIYGNPATEGMDTAKLIDTMMDKTKRISAEEKALAKPTGNVQVYKKERKEKLMKKSGQVGLNRPYRAPVYRTYWECIQGLYKQGLLGFYKGNSLRLVN